MTPPTTLPTTLPTPQTAPRSFSGQRVGVVGIGIEGQDAVTFLAREDAEVVRVDQRPERAERRPDDLTLLDEVDALIVSQGVHYQQPLLLAAEQRGVPIYGPMQLLLERCPGLVVGITGSAGKTTTTTLVYRMLQAEGLDCMVGGNIGRGLLSRLREIKADTTVVVEISHTQLLRATRSPQVAAITNITPNHLDQFSWEQYQALKYRIVEQQTASDRVALPLNDPLARRAATMTPARVSWFGIGSPDAAACHSAALSDGQTIYRDGQPLLPVADLQIPGEHNLCNALAALAIVGERVSDATAVSVLKHFEGVGHRLELVGEVNGVRFVNDSIATTPERTLAGLRAIEGEIVLLLGGRDKQLALDPLLDEIRRRVSRVVLFGEAAPKWSAWLGAHGIESGFVHGLEAAVDFAARSASAGQTVLLSPSGTSFDAYPNFEARGQHFRELVDRWELNEGNERDTHGA